MNKSNVRQKRSLGKDSPLSKRPKLDFTLRSKEIIKDDKCNSKGSPKKRNGVLKEKTSGTSYRRNLEDTPPTASDWDEDFSGDMLEKVCLIADLSQAMVNNPTVPKEVEKKEKSDLETLERNKAVANSLPPPSDSSGNAYENLKLELQKLQEKLKTKEGEVHILRSQLKQSEDAKQAVALQNIKVIEEIQKKCNEKVSSTEKELESTKSKLLFRDLEYKTLSERCRQLEYNASKNKLSEPVNPTKSFNLSQTVLPKPFLKETLENNQSVVIGNPEENVFNFDFATRLSHEGKCLGKMICPEFFKFTNETSIVAFYKYHGKTDTQRAGVNFDKTEEYKWNDLPKQTLFIKDLYDSVSSLFTFNNFLHKSAQKIIQSVLDSCIEILTYQKKVLSFLEEIQLCSDYDDADQSLLQNEEKAELISVRNLIDGTKLNEDECGIEGRRALGLIYSLMKTSQVAFDKVKDNTDFIKLLLDLVTAIGTLRRPIRYSGTLLGVAIIMQKLLEEDKLTKESLKLINKTVEEIIFSRPKLNVLMEVINVLTAGKNHSDFLMSFCRKESVDSCTLYLDCKLNQAMFFTKSACPLKLFCMQIMSLACLPSSESVRWKITLGVIKWLNNSMNTPYFKKINWLPINSALRQERCFDVTECLLHLLILCLKDYLGSFSEGSFTPEASEEAGKRKIGMILTIAQGAVLLRRILKADQRQFHDNTYFLRFAALLKSFLPSKSDLCQKTHLSHMSPLQVEAINWITDLIDNDLRNQDCYLKQSTSVLSDDEFYNALKINDDPKIY